MDTNNESDNAVQPFNIRSGGNTFTSADLGSFFAAGRYGGLSRAQSLRVAAGLSCYDVISQDVSRTPLHLCRMTESGPEKLKASEHEIAKLLKFGVNEWMGFKEWLRITAFHLPIYQEATSLLRRNGRNSVMEIYLTNPERCRVEINTTAKRYFYRVIKGNQHEMVQLDWAPDMMPARNVLHLRGRSLDGLVALPSSVLGREVYETLTHMRKFVSDIFARGGIDVFAIGFPDTLTDKQFGRLQNGLRTATKKSKDDAEPLILEGAAGERPEVKSLTMTSADDNFVKTNETIVKEACRLLRVPPHKIFALESVKYDNISEMDRIYVTDTLGFYFDTIEEGMNRRLVDQEADPDLFFAFERDAAYAIDPEKKNKIWRERLESGACTYDEFRSATGQKLWGGKAGGARLIKGAAMLVDTKNEVLVRSGKGDAAENSVPDDSEDGKKKSPNLQVVK